MFRHYCVILRELNLVVSILPSYTSMSMQLLVEWKRNLMAHGDAREEK